MVKCWQELRIKGKFVKSIDIENKDITHFSSRWYYKILVTKDTRTFLGIHQEDERYPEVNNLRPYIDVGLALIKYNDGIYKLVDYIDTKVQREVFLELYLEKGEYYIVPTSVGIALKFKREEEIITNFTMKNSKVVSFAKDLYEKYDIICNGFLSYKELKAFYKFMDEDLTEKEFMNIVVKFNVGDLNLSIKEGLTEKGFLNLFENILQNHSLKFIEKMIKNLGYDRTLFSRRSRVFMLSIHSDELIKLSVKDALKDNIDFVVNKLLIRKYGKSIHDDDKKNKKNVDAFYYFNKNIHCYSYGVYNKTSKTIKATLDLSKSKKLLYNLEHPKVTKIVEPKSMEFMIHAQCDKGVEEYFRFASLTWD